MEVSGLSFHYPVGKPLWQDVSFSCCGGKIVGIMEKNSAGKTPLCRVLMGLEKPFSGAIRLNGKGASKRQRRKASFSVVQDVDYQLIAGSVAEELRMGHERDPDIEEKISGVLHQFSLSDYADSHPTELSGGQKQRLSIALACLSGKKILFFDEPTSRLDAAKKKTKEIKKIKGPVRIGVFSALWIAVSFAISCSITFFAPVLLVQTLDKKRGAAHVAAKVEQTNRLREYLTGMKVIKAYNLGGSNFTKLTRAFRNFMSESIKLEAVSGPFYLVAISFLQAGVWLLSGGKVDISVFVMFLFMGNRVFEPLAGAITQLPVNVMLGHAAVGLGACLRGI